MEKKNSERWRAYATNCQMDFYKTPSLFCKFLFCIFYFKIEFNWWRFCAFFKISYFLTFYPHTSGDYMNQQNPLEIHYNMLHPQVFWSFFHFFIYWLHNFSDKPIHTGKIMVTGSGFGCKSLYYKSQFNSIQFSLIQFNSIHNFVWFRQPGPN